jgi:uncharacterized protein (DUF1697 family)
VKNQPSETTYIALLRAVNVGGTGKLPMADLKRMCEALGFTHVRTYIASGNVIFRSDMPAAKVKAALEAALEIYAAKPVGVMIRDAAEMSDVLAANPFADAQPNRVVAIFLQTPPPAATDMVVKGQCSEQISCGKREIYVHYGDGMAESKLSIAEAKSGTARNMNTIAKLVEMARDA